MSLASIVKETCSKLDISVSELSRRIGQSPQNLGKKLNNETLNYDEFLEILSVLGVKYEYRVTTSNDETMELMSNRTRVKFEILAGKMENQQKLIDYLYYVLRDVKTGLETVSSSACAAISKIENQKLADELRQLGNAQMQMATLLASGQKIIEVGTGKTYEEDGRPLEGYKCLLVESQEFPRQATAGILESSGLVVDTAIDAEAALAMAIGGGYDFILLEKDLPDMNGIAVAKKIREKDKHIPIIAFLKTADFADIISAHEAGMNDYVVKPLAINKLLAMVSSYIK